MNGLLPGYKKCFFCGPATGGLGLELRYTDGEASCEFTASDKFQGYDGMLHGGIITGVLDEVMWWTLFMETRQMCATSKIEIEFKRPILCGKTYRASATFLQKTRKIYYLSGLIKDETGKLCARGSASFREWSFTLEALANNLDFRGVPPEIRAIFQSPDA
jgi:uncharacterized protein (TIGR00369 family)